MQVLLGQRLSADINLVAQLLLLAGLWLGAYLARRRRFRRHHNHQAIIVGANLLLIALVMIPSFVSYVIAGRATANTVARLMMIHGLLGLLVELTGVYLVLHQPTGLIPPRLRVRNFRLTMRILLGLWTLTVALGCSIYYTRYLAPYSDSAAALAPAGELLQAVDDVQIHAEEMAIAAQRGNLATSRRHAEHLVNLIVGRNSPDYGDLDGDGRVEDPGDGTGALVYLQRVRARAGLAGSRRVQALALMDQVQATLNQMVAEAKDVLQAPSASAAAAHTDRILALAQELSARTGAVAQIAQLEGVPASQTGPAPGTPGTATVVMKDYTFVPRQLIIPRGTTVTFLNQDPAKHTVTADKGEFDSGNIGPGQSFTYTFGQAGTFPYYCVYHGDRGGVDMAGSIIVTP